MRQQAFGWPRASVRRSRTVAIALVIALNAMGAGATAAAEPQAQKPATAPPERSSVPLADGLLREVVERFEARLALPSDVAVEDGRVLVEVIYTGAKGAAERAIERLGGEVNGYAGTTLLQALVPIGNLTRLERAPEVTEVRAPLRAGEPLTSGTGPDTTSSSPAATAGQAVAKTKADAWHAAGFTGAGVKIGIIDYFDQAKWNAARTAGEVPAASGTFCISNGGACNLFQGGSPHGVAVAETIHEMAPGAQIYLASAGGTASDLQATVNYFASKGVKIISRSLGMEYDWRGNGEGPTANIVKDAVAKGMTWFNSAGNSARGGGYPGSYWRGSWSDPDNDKWLNWSGTGHEALQVYCGFTNGFRWSDWGASRTDYDVYLYDDPAGTILKAQAINDQAAGAYPIEYIRPNCAAGTDIDYMWVKLYAPGAGTSGDVLEFQVHKGLPNLGLASNPFSAAVPVVDSPLSIAVGAIDPPNGTTIAAYSSQGPTNDNRIKPDLSAASCFYSLSYAPGCFDGTSAATPVAAGAGALVLQRGLASTPAQLKAYLMTHAVVDRGTAGPDRVYGSGELILPAPNSKPTAPGNVSATPLSSSSIRVNWTDSSGETSYSFYRWNGSAWVNIGSGAQGTTSFTQGGLTPGSTYYYLVCANNGAGQTCANWVSVTTPGTPTAPSNMSATPLSSSSIRVNWTDSSGETSYSFYRWNGSAWAGIGTGAQNTTSFTQGGLAAGSTYYYLVCANNSAGQTCGGWVSVTTFS